MDVLDDYYDLDGNGHSCVKVNEFIQFETSIDTITSVEISMIPSTSKFVFTCDEEISGLKVDELRQELPKRILSKT